MFNERGISVLDIGQKEFDKIDLYLASGERIVGVQSRIYSETEQAHCDLTFVIGRLE
jgi:hypothetical protein